MIGYTGWEIPDGKVVQVTDASGRVIWQRLTAGSVIWRPSADISVEHALYPPGSVSAYQLINEEVSDGQSTYIWTNGADRTSRFKLDGKSPPVGATITSVTLCADPLAYTGTTTVSLYIAGEASFESLIATPDKATENSIPSAVNLINNYLADNKSFPPCEISVTSSYTQVSTYKEAEEAGISQVYLVITYE